MDKTQPRHPTSNLERAGGAAYPVHEHPENTQPLLYASLYAVISMSVAQELQAMHGA